MGHSTKALENTFQIKPSCSNTKLHIFIQVVCTGNTSLVGGDNNWSDIIEEYNDICSDENQAQILLLQKEYTRVNNKIQLIQEIVNSLSLRYHQGLCDCLRSLGFRIKYSPDTISENLKLTVTQSKQLVLKREEIKDELSQFVSDKQPTEFDYDTKLAALGQFQKYHIDKYTCSITEYVAVKNLYEQHIKQLEKELNNKPN